MRFHEAVRRTMFEYRLTGKALSLASGIDQTRISKFKAGNMELQTDSLERLLDAMPDEARRYCLELVATKQVS